MPTYRISRDGVGHTESFDHEPTFEVDIKGLGSVCIEMLKPAGNQCVDFLSAVNAWELMTTRAIVANAVEVMDGCTFIEANQRVRCAGVFGDVIYLYHFEVTMVDGRITHRTVEMPGGASFLDVLTAVTGEGTWKRFRFLSPETEFIPVKEIVSAKVIAGAAETSRCGAKADTYLYQLAQATVTKERAIRLAVEILEACPQADAAEILRARGFEVQND